MAEELGDREDVAGSPVARRGERVTQRACPTKEGRAQACAHLRTVRKLVRMGKLLTTAEAAQRLGISITTLNRWANNGTIPVAVQAPGRTGTRLYDEAVIDAHADTTTAA